MNALFIVAWVVFGISVLIILSGFFKGSTTLEQTAKYLGSMLMLGLLFFAAYEAFDVWGVKGLGLVAGVLWFVNALRKNKE